jgi:hypothetical protein
MSTFKPVDDSLDMRVQLHPSTDQWMMGDRYGTVTGRTRAGGYRVKMDRSGRTLRVAPAHIGEWMGRASQAS